MGLCQIVPETLLYANGDTQNIPIHALQNNWLEQVVSNLREHIEYTRYNLGNKWGILYLNSQE